MTSTDRIQATTLDEQHTTTKLKSHEEFDASLEEYIQHLRDNKGRVKCLLATAIVEDAERGAPYYGLKTLMLGPAQLIEHAAEHTFDQLSKHRGERNV